MIWKAVKGYEGIAEISTTGIVRTVDRIIKSGPRGTTIRKYTSKIKSQTLDKDGYCRVTLCKNNVKKRVKVHDMVLSTFNREKKEKEQCRHLDGNRKNNNLNNLKWGTAKENCDDRARHGKWIHPKGMKGKKHSIETRRKMSDSHKRRNKNVK